MKKLYFFSSFVMLSFCIYAQIPQVINYQGIARDNAGNILVNENISLRLSILSGSETGPVVYVETHSKTTDGYGLFTLLIGQGTVTLGSFSAIDWGTDAFFLKVEIDPSGGTNYMSAGVSQFAVTPYALHAKTAENGFSGNYNDLTNLPVLFDGNWQSLTNIPTTLAGYGITDAMSTSHAANAITSGNINNWNTAYNWGNHAGLYRSVSYVPAWTEITDKPSFATVATSGSYSDLTDKPILWDSTWASIKNKPNTLMGYGITDAMSTTHAANAITSGNINNWNTAYSWGNHAGLYRLINYVPSWTEITSNPFLFISVANNQLIKYNSTSGKWENWMPNYLTAYTETDPLWTTASGNYYTKTNMQTSGAAQIHFGNITGKPTTLAGYGITDAMSTGHVANSITANNITDWNTAYGWGNHAGLYRLISYVPAWTEITGKPNFATVATSGSYSDLTNKPTGQNPGDMLYWDGTEWIPVPVGTNGQALVLNNGIPTWGGIEYPILNTNDITEITVNTATSGGYIASDAGAAVTARGVCWSLSASPTIADSKTTDGAGAGSFTSHLSGLTIDTTYHARAYATNSVGTGYGAEMVFNTQDGIIILTTATISDTTPTSAKTGGNIVTDGGSPVTVRGVCYSTSPNPTTADSIVECGSGTGSFIANLSDLTLNTSYHVRAYATNSINTYYGNELIFNTLAWLCGTSTLAVNHVVTSGVAPVEKSVTYSTVKNIAGETTKCWITSNLGATNQATAVSDATEASAGWYWQFNRKQGYKHDGTTRTPATTWVSSISENSNWTSANDPCTIELGSVWRIPTNTEWTNVDAGGSWSTWTGPWNSGLKLHAAGFLSSSTGVLTNRGSIGYYWSSTQFSSSNGSHLYFSSSNCGVSNSVKAIGFNIRCLRE